MPPWISQLAFGASVSSVHLAAASYPAGGVSAVHWAPDWSEVQLPLLPGAASITSKTIDVAVSGPRLWTTSAVFAMPRKPVGVTDSVTERSAAPKPVLSVETLLVPSG